ncbi:N-acetyllactosaminide beta-1,3-N-acetylglucosaminyltransferase 2 isoform X2 [Salmo trutta]|uniref:N-acetyllactosaminide beta-1,3-N-acetylglucosaminyltransferase 2 isoform X2 n=1 Tax=Salmo trutta TaxID=8032 RepID=UPI0011328056|nr:N-acetyllactosaminide beta-1,3-N-acetylglucosaminyltransferase 2-like isoform X2 [Salmo trutta]
MAGLRRKLKFLVTLMTVNLFIFILVFHRGGQDKGHNKVLVPSKRFWSKLAPSQAYWNRQQQRLDLQHNPILAASNSNNTSDDDDVRPVPDWLNDTGLNPDPCQPDYRVTTHVKDYNSLPPRFKDFLLYMRCRSYSLVVDQPHVCQKTRTGEPPFLLLAVKSLAPHFDRRQAIRQSWGRAGVLANRTVVTVFLLGNTTAVDHHPDLSEMLRYENAHHRDILQVTTGNMLVRVPGCGDRLPGSVAPESRSGTMGGNVNGSGEFCTREVKDCDVNGSGEFCTREVKDCDGSGEFYTREVKDCEGSGEFCTREVKDCDENGSGEFCTREVKDCNVWPV